MVFPLIQGVHMKKSLILAPFLCVLATSLEADSPSFSPVPAKHLEVTSVSKIEVRDRAEAQAGGPRVKIARGSQVFQFVRPDGTRVIGIDGAKSPEHEGNSRMAASLWSTDDGQTWTWREGPSDDAPNYAPATVGEKAAIQLADGEILAIYRTAAPMKRNIPGNEAFFRNNPALVNSKALFYLGQRRSTDGWVQASRELAPLDTPNAVPIQNDGGGQESGYLMHHGLIELPNGELLATLYGNDKEDQVPENLADGYPPSFGMYKVRLIVVRSTDRGRTWGDARTVASRMMTGRDEGGSASTAGNIPVPAVTQEGFSEADLVAAPNGDLLCLMRSGGRLGTPTAPIYSTPLYQSRSTDGGKTWIAPVQIAPFGVNPNVVALENGVLAATYARPGGWVMFSTDNGLTWSGHRQLTPSDAYTNLLASGRNEFTVYYHQSGAIFGERFRVEPVKK